MSHLISINLIYMSYTNSLYHLVIRPKDSKPVITEKYERDLYAYINGLCKNNKCTLYRINGMPHILANAAWGNDQHFQPVWSSKKIPFTHFTEREPNWAQQFHVWRMDWDEKAIRLYLDDELLNDTPLSTTVNGSIGQNKNPFQSPQYILLNLALGGDCGGTIDDSALPMRYEIDYVRIYEKR